MQQEIVRRSNRERTDATRTDLIAAARQLFTEKSYADTSTPEIVAAAGVTRGALYHHFADKQALFAAVVENEAAMVAATVDNASWSSTNPFEILLEGGGLYLEAMRFPGRTRLLLIDGPAVLGPAEMDAIHDRHGNRTLREGLRATMDAGLIHTLPLDALVSHLGSMFDRAALSIENGAAAKDQLEVINTLMSGMKA
jgi:AcrR family transcriptional regulator